MANDRYCINKYYYILSKEVLAWLAYLFSFRSLFLIYASHVHHPPSHQSPPPPISQLLFKVSWTFFSWSRVLGASLVAQTLKRLPAMRETLVRFLGREDPLDKRMATHSSVPENHMDRGAWWTIVHGVTKSRTWLSNWQHIFALYAFLLWPDHCSWDLEWKYTLKCVTFCKKSLFFN